MAITSQVALGKGLRISDDAKHPSSKGTVSEAGMHVPDTDIIDGKNTIPTYAGYVSFFGTDRNLDNTVLGSLKVQESFSFRTEHGDVVQIVLTSGGLYLSSSAGSATATRTYTAGSPSTIAIDLPDGQGDWIRAVWGTHVSPWELWTYALVDNDLYLYHKGLKYIYRMYSVEPEQVMFDELEPSYVISTGTIYQFIINAQDDSTGDDTWKAVEFNTTGPANYLGKFTHPVDKAHQVWNIEQTVLSPFHGAYNASLDITTLTKTDIDAQVPLIDGYTSENLKVYANGEPDELITSFVFEDLIETGAGRGNQELVLRCENIILGGIITITYDGTDYDFDTSTYTTQLEVTQAFTTWADTTLPDGFKAWRYGDDTSAVTNNKDELTFFILGASTLVEADPQIYPSATYSGTTDAISFIHADSANGPYEPNAKIRILGYLQELDDYSTFSAGEEVSITIEGTTFALNATASESAASVLGRLHALIVADTKYEDFDDGDANTFNFRHADSLNFPVGGVGSIPISASNNISAHFDNDNTGIVYNQIAALRIQGFKEYGLTQLGLEVDGTFYNIPMSSIYDSNNVASLIWSTLNTLSITDGALDVTTAASAYADYDLIINIPILDGSVPAETLTQDGTTQWALAGGSPTTESVDLLQVDGIMAARGRLGYWLQDGTMGWSATNDPIDFTPSTVTRANQISVKALKGKIIKCVSYENGFIVYATGNVIHGAYVKDLDKVFSFTVIDTAPGIIDPRHVVSALGLHYYWHTMGLYILDPRAAQVKEQLEDLSDWINIHKYPITLQVLGDRYLVLNTLEALNTFSNRKVRNGGVTIQGHVDPFAGSPVEIPAAQQGLNLYPTYKRAYVFDTKLGKWGSADLDYLVLSSMVPINQSGYQLDKDYQNTTQYLDNHQKGLLVLGSAGKLWIANDNPSDSYLVFGHYAAHRTRRTKIISAHFEFVDYPDATMEFEPSLDHATIDWDRKVTKDMKLLRTSVHPNMSAYWFNCTLRGRYHVKRGLIKGQKHGR